jgi:hypothetical protein
MVFLMLIDVLDLCRMDFGGRTQGREQQDGFWISRMDFGGRTQGREQNRHLA